VKVDSLLDQTKGMQNRSMVVNYQRRCRASRWSCGQRRPAGARAV